MGKRRNFVDDVHCRRFNKGNGKLNYWECFVRERVEGPRRGTTAKHHYSGDGRTVTEAYRAALKRLRTES